MGQFLAICIKAESVSPVNPLPIKISSSGHPLAIASTPENEIKFHKYEINFHIYEI